MSVTGRHLVIGMTLAALVHAGVAAAVFWAPPPPGAQAVGFGGVEVSLGPAGGAPGDVAAPVPTQETPPAETTETPPDVAPAEATPVEMAEAPAEPVPERLPVEPIRPVEPEAVIPVETVQALPPPVETKPPEQAAEAKPVIPPPPRRKPKPPESERVETPPPEPIAPEEPPAEQVAAASSVAGAGGKAGAQDSAEAGSAESASGGGSPAASADYMAYLLAWLQKHKEYPEAAQRRRQQGTALLYFEMDREGRVRNARLRRSSGHAALDAEAVALLERAAPLPPPPPEVTGDPIKLVVPVQFFLK